MFSRFHCTNVCHLETRPVVHKVQGIYCLALSRKDLQIPGTDTQQNTNQVLLVFQT